MYRCYLILFTTASIFFSCEQEKESNPLPVLATEITPIEIPDTIIDKDSLVYHNNNSTWTLDDNLYSGYAVSHFDNNELKEKFGIVNGKKQGQTILWYPDGHYKTTANYYGGKLHGEKKSWTSDSSHVLIARLQYVAGKAHGEQTKWYPTGELFKSLHLNMGQEEGIQKAYRKNGDLYANYEAKDGRIFGMKKAALCFGLEDENIQK